MFRQLVNELTLLLTYEATKDLADEEVEIETPLERDVGTPDLGEEGGRLPDPARGDRHAGRGAVARSRRSCRVHRALPRRGDAGAGRVLREAPRRHRGPRRHPARPDARDRELHGRRGRDGEARRSDVGAAHRPDRRPGRHRPRPSRPPRRADRRRGRRPRAERQGLRPCRPRRRRRSPVPAQSRRDRVGRAPGDAGGPLRSRDAFAIVVFLLAVGGMARMLGAVDRPDARRLNRGPIPGSAGSRSSSGSSCRRSPSSTSRARAEASCWAPQLRRLSARSTTFAGSRLP